MNVPPLRPCSPLPRRLLRRKAVFTPHTTRSTSAFTFLPPALPRWRYGLRFRQAAENPGIPLVPRFIAFAQSKAGQEVVGNIGSHLVPCLAD